MIFWYIVLFAVWVYIGYLYVPAITRRLYRWIIPDGMGVVPYAVPIRNLIQEFRLAWNDILSEERIGT